MWEMSCLTRRILLNYLNRQFTSIHLDAGRSHLLFANNPLNPFRLYLSVPLPPVFFLSDRTLTLAFLYDIVSLFPGEAGGATHQQPSIDSISGAARRNVTYTLEIVQIASCPWQRRQWERGERRDKKHQFLPHIPW